MKTIRLSVKFEINAPELPEVEVPEAPEAVEEDDDVAEGIEEEWEFKKHKVVPEIEVPEVEETPEEETDDIIESVEEHWEFKKRQVPEVGAAAPTIPSLPGHDAIIVDVSPEIEETPAEITDDFLEDVEDDFERRSKRQVIGDTLGPVGDVVGDLTPFDFGYDGDYDDYKN